MSKLLRVLREAGLVAVRAEGRTRWYALRPAPLAEVDARLEPYRQHWTFGVDPAIGREAFATHQVQT